MKHHKVCLIGASAVGKTSLIRQFVDGIFSEKYLTTIGVKIDKKQVSTPNGDIEFMIWDIEGTDKFSGFSPRFLNGASAYIVVVDQSRPSSITDGLDIFAKAQSSSNAAGYLAINKADLPSQLSEQQRASLNNAGFHQTVTTSAKNGDNVEQLFTTIATVLIKEHQ